MLKSEKQSEIITFQPKAFDAIDIKSDITEHPETSQNLPKNVRQAEKVSSNNSLYSDTKRAYFKKENVRITKWAHAFKDYLSSYNVKILNSFNPELQLKDTESAIISKLMEILRQLQSFKFVTNLVLVLKKIAKINKVRHFLFKLKIRNNYQGKWHWKRV